jgi:tetratricopeptide (TPR) repeat protein
MPARGTIDLPSVELRTKEGSALQFQLALDYTLSRSLAPQLAEDIRRVGLEGAVKGVAQHVLEEVGRRTDSESLLSSPASVETPLRAAFEAAGVGVSRLSFRSRLGDEVVRRARTDEARRMVRSPLARVIVVGWDGADWDIAKPLMASGRMPNLARFVREGAWTSLRSYDPMFSPLLWTTVATGKPPTEHGIADFLVRDAASGDRRPITSDFRKVKALWNILTDFDRSSAWIGWWATYPAEATRGLIVTDYLGAALGSKSPEEAAALPGVVSPAGALQDPSALLTPPSRISKDEIARIIPVSDAEYRAALDEIAKAPEKAGKDKSRVENPVAFVMRVLAVSRSYQNIALAELKQDLPVVGVYFEGVDMMGHGFQHCLPPKMAIVSDADFERFKAAVPNYYAYQDALLGELLRAAGPDTVTVLLSDHGFRTGDGRPNFVPSTKGQPEEWHRDWGLIALHGPGISAGEIPRASIYDVTPTLLYLCGLPLAEDMPGRLLGDAFDPSVVRGRPVTRIRSYELVGSRLERSAGVPADPAAMKEMMANLRALGYVGGAEDEPRPAAGGAESAEGPAETQYFFHRNLAVQYIRQGRFGDAEAELLLANERKPQGKTYEMLSQVRANQGRYADAVAALEEGWERVPDLMDPSSVLWIVDIDLLAGDPEAARNAAAKRSAELTPALRRAVDGRLAEAAGDVPRAIDAYRGALEDDPLLVRIAQRLHDLEIARGEPFAIEPFLLRTVDAHPQVDAYWDMAGQLALSRGDNDVAVERFRKANALQPDDGLYLGHLASALAAVGRDREARSSLAWAERFPPTGADGWMALGGAWDRLGEADRAVAAFRAAKAAGFKGPGADIGAALALARAGRTAEARRVLADATRQFPDSAAIQQVRARLGS